MALVDSLQNTSTISVNTTSKTATVTCSATGGTKPYLFTIREDISETTKYSRGETITFQLSDYSHYHFTVVVTDANNISAVVDKGELSILLVEFWNKEVIMGVYGIEEVEELSAAVSGKKKW